jgi:EAL domain-containing protein (putative c-di-GMP-specific phosphodiesterase class I)
VGQVALDDFGAGYGGLTHLKDLPIDYLKIDSEFVRDLRENTASRNVVRGIVNPAQGFGLKTIGDGVSVRDLSPRGCDAGESCPGYAVISSMIGTQHGICQAEDRSLEA